MSIGALAGGLWPAGPVQADGGGLRTGTVLRPPGADPYRWPKDEEIGDLFTQGRRNETHSIILRLAGAGDNRDSEVNLEDWVRIQPLSATSPVFDHGSRSPRAWREDEFLITPRRLRHFLRRHPPPVYPNDEGKSVDIGGLLAGGTGPKTVVLAIRGAVPKLKHTLPSSARQLRMIQPDFHNFRCTVIVWKLAGNANGSGDQVACFPASTVPNRQSILTTLEGLRNLPLKPGDKFTDCNMMLDGVYLYKRGRHGLELSERRTKRDPFGGISNVLRGHMRTPCVRPVLGAGADVAAFTWEPFTTPGPTQSGRGMAFYDNVHLAETMKIQPTALFSSEGCITIPGYLTARDLGSDAEVVGLFSVFQQQVGLVGPNADAVTEYPFIMCSGFRYRDSMRDFPG